jgi:hypothetical protein
LIDEQRFSEHCWSISLLVKNTRNNMIHAGIVKNL